MIISKEVETKWSGSNKKWFIDKGYIYTKIGDILKVKVKDLSNKSNVYINVKCDNCGEELVISLYNYNKSLKNGNYYCIKCRNYKYELFTKKERTKTIIKNGKSFEQWCLDNNRQDILDRWDYELNKCKPSEITYSTNVKYYFKCLRGIHISELKSISNFINRQKNSMDCKQCNSFAQWGIDNLGKDFLEKYWDYKKNTVNPWKISFQSNRKVWIKCQEKDYHGSYDVYCSHFINGIRCSYCYNTRGKVHTLDSLGALYPNSLEVWSDKNKKSPYEYSPMSRQEVWWKCPDGIHDDYLRDIRNTNRCGFRCPYCSGFSKGEKRIEEYLIKNNINYIPQKEFENLLGVGNGNLSYDFYLPDYNLLIEYQGEQHERPIDFDGKGKKYAKSEFKKQQEHDTRKREYAITNNINLLEIWYRDFDNIEEILNKELDK